MRRSYLEERALEAEEDLEMGAEVPGSGTQKPTGRREAGKCGDTAVLNVVKKFRSYSRLGDSRDRRDGLAQMWE